MSDNILVIVKLAERCNLNCSYCYMYTGADQSWRSRPALLSPTLRRGLVERCEEYLAERQHATVTLEFHGGEPLLIGKQRFAELLEDLRGALGYERARFCLQTNGTMLDDEWCDLFERQAVSWAISCDGPPKIHDRFRVFRNGAPSSETVERALRLCVGRKSSYFGGVLSVIDPTTDGAEVVRYFYKLGVRNFDLLLPDANYISPPPHLAAGFDGPLLRYLRAAFDEWISCGDSSFRVRLFEEIMKGIYGRRSNLDAFGADLWGIMVLESDGTYQLLDVLRLGGEAEVTTGLNVTAHSFSDFLDATRDVFPGPCQTCLECPVFSACRGGYQPHRFDGKDYDRPSVYCDVLYGLIVHIYEFVRSVTPMEMWRDESSDPPRPVSASSASS
jgi:uncharacterized protein